MSDPSSPAVWTCDRCGISGTYAELLDHSLRTEHAITSILPITPASVQAK